MSDKHVLGFRLTFLRRFWDFLMIFTLLSQDFDVEIYALLSRDFDVEIYALFPQIFRDWKTDSANSFAFRMYASDYGPLGFLELTPCINFEL